VRDRGWHPYFAAQGAGPAPKSDESVDIIDEAITLFRSTILFKNFSPKGPADKIIVYLTVFI
jgi:actin related protein 2/3 complex, subunit 3